MDLGLVFDAIHNGALRLAELESEVKKPNDPNVRRLRFIRRVTSKFMREFGTPHRSLVLALTSVFFSTEDLDELLFPSWLLSRRERRSAALNQNRNS